MSIWIYYDYKANLSSQNLKLIIQELQKQKKEIYLFSQNNEIELTFFKKVLIRDIDFFYRYSQSSDILISGIKTPGEIERELLTFAKSKSMKSILFISDLGYSPIKLFDKRKMNYVEPDYIIVPDKITYSKFSDLQNSILIKGGLPYLDFLNLNNNIDSFNSTRISFMSLPIDSDKFYWKWNLDYSNNSIKKDLNYIAKVINDRSMNYRYHPKEFFNDKEGFNNIKFSEAGDCNIYDFIKSSKLIVSTYSTSLILSAALGIQSISYQPSKVTIREELFNSIGIPVIKNKEKLLQIIKKSKLKKEYKLNETIYNFNKSIPQLLKILYEI